MNSPTLRHRTDPNMVIVGRSSLQCLVVAIVAGALFGPIVLAGQVHTPYPLANLFNSPAVWAAAAFGFGMWARSKIRAVLGAIVMEVVAVMAYYLASVLVGSSGASIMVSATALAWCALGIGAGVIFGTAGAAVDDPSKMLRAVGTALLPAVFFAEASNQVVRYVTTDPAGRPDDLISTSIMLTALAAAALIWLLRGRASVERAYTLGLTVAVASVGSIGYSVLTR
jgi:Family of unknown function (DUF6518)